MCCRVQNNRCIPDNNWYHAVIQLWIIFLVNSAISDKKLNQLRYYCVSWCWSISGGGLPIGSILLIEEDKFARYSKYLSKIFLAEGGVHKHVLFLASLNNDPNEMVCSFAFAFHLNSNSKNPYICSIFFRFKNCLQQYRIQKIQKMYHICHTIKTMITTTTMA